MAIKKNTQTPATASAAAAAPVTENNASAKKAKVVKKTVTSTTAPATASASAPAPKKETVAAPVDAAVSAAATEDVADVVDDNTLMELSSVFFSKLQTMTQTLTQLKTEYRTLEKKWLREIKLSQKVAKKKRKNGNRAPSGFVKPTRISDELAGFLGVAKGVEMARTDVTKEITSYIRQHNLQDKENGRKINPDAKLKGLLHITSEEVLTYFNLQKYMSPHFAKNVKAAAAGEA